MSSNRLRLCADIKVNTVTKEIEMTTPPPEFDPGPVQDLDLAGHLLNEFEPQLPRGAVWKGDIAHLGRFVITFERDLTG